MKCIFVGFVDNICIVKIFLWVYCPRDTVWYITGRQYNMCKGVTHHFYVGRLAQRATFGCSITRTWRQYTPHPLLTPTPPKPIPTCYHLPTASPVDILGSKNGHKGIPGKSIVKTNGIRWLDYLQPPPSDIGNPLSTAL